MRFKFDDADYWLLRAAEVRAKAKCFVFYESKIKMLRVAQTYEAMAHAAQNRSEEKTADC